MSFKTDTVFPHIPAATIATSATFPPEKRQNVANVADVAGGIERKMPEGWPLSPQNVANVADVAGGYRQKSAGMPPPWQGATVAKNATTEPGDEEPGPTRADYENFCPGYWQRCAACPEFDAMAVLFCRKYNREHAEAFPFAEVESEAGKERLILPDDEPGGPAFKPLRCVGCVQWKDTAGGHVGYCAKSGRIINLKSKCDLGAEAIEKPQKRGKRRSKGR